MTRRQLTQTDELTLEVAGVRCEELSSKFAFQWWRLKADGHLSAENDTNQTANPESNGGSTEPYSDLAEEDPTPRPVKRLVPAPIANRATQLEAMPTMIAMLPVRTRNL